MAEIVGNTAYVTAKKSPLAQRAFFWE